MTKAPPVRIAAFRAEGGLHNHQREADTMKTALIAVSLTGALFLIAPAAAPVFADEAQGQQTIKTDTQTIHQDRKTVRTDKATKRTDIKQRNSARRQFHKDVASGNSGAVKQDAKTLHADRKTVRGDRRTDLKDRAALHGDKKTRRHDVKQLHQNKQG